MTVDQLTPILEPQLDRPEAEHLRAVLAALDQHVRFALGDSVVDGAVHARHTEVFRWLLKHHAAVLSGATGGSLAPEVPESAVRDEAARLAVERHDSALAAPEYLANGWGQPHEVLTNCRMLYTATTGAVCGKIAAAQWCLDVVADEWHPLIRAAISSRPDPWQRVHQQADPELTALTALFITDMKSRILAAAKAGAS